MLYCPSCPLQVSTAREVIASTDAAGAAEQMKDQLLPGAEQVGVGQCKGGGTCLFAHGACRIVTMDSETLVASGTADRSTMGQCLRIQV
jgi:hypothetical protein